MRVSCYCKRYLINPENATHVKNGVPMCHEHTCAKVKEHREAMALRRTPFSDDQEHDRVAEPYARSLYARYQDI